MGYNTNKADRSAHVSTNQQGGFANRAVSHLAKSSEQSAIIINPLYGPYQGGSAALQNADTACSHVQVVCDHRNLNKLGTWHCFGSPRNIWDAVNLFVKAPWYIGGE